MKKTYIFFMNLFFILFLSNHTFADYLNLVPSEAKGFLQIKNIENTMTAIDKTLYKIDSTSFEKDKYFSDFFYNVTGVRIRNKDDFKKYFINQYKDLLIFWINKKAYAYAYSITFKQKVLDRIIKEKDQSQLTVFKYNDVEIFTFRGKDNETGEYKEESFLFIDYFLVHCTNEGLAILIIDAVKDNNKSIKSNPKYIEYSEFEEKSEITCYFDLESFSSESLLPFLFAYRDYISNENEFREKFLTDFQNEKAQPKIAKDERDIYSEIINNYLNQINSARLNVDIYDNNIIIDSQFKLNNNKLIQKDFDEKETKLDFTKYFPLNTFYLCDLNLKPYIVKDISEKIFELLNSNKLDKKSIVFKQFQFQTFDFNREIAFAAVPSKENKIDLLFIFDKKDSSDNSSNSELFQLSVEILKDVNMDFFTNLKHENISTADFFLKTINTDNYKEHKISQWEYKLVSIRNLKKESANYNLNNLFFWQADINNKRVICLSSTDKLIKQTIDLILNKQHSTRSDTTLTAYNYFMKNLHENPDAIFYISLRSLLENNYKYFNLIKQKECFQALEEIENAASKYKYENGKYPSNIEELVTADKLKTDLLKGTLDVFLYDNNTGDAICSTHGFLEESIPLEKIKEDKRISALINNTANGINISLKTQNQIVGFRSNIDINIVQTFLKMKIYINDYNLTPLMIALREEKQEKAKELIATSWNINSKDEKGRNSLIYALKYNQPMNALLLIKKGADINVKDTENWTPLMYAMVNNQPNIAKLLIGTSVDINVKNTDNCTALMYALKYNQPENAKLLIEKGADINVKNRDNWTALMYALVSKQPNIAKLLIEKGADINIKNSYNCTALMYALENSQPDIAKLLIEKDADVNVKNIDNWTTLMYAIKYDQPGNAKLLIKKGVDIKEKSNENLTPLMYALKFNQSSIAISLIDKNANINEKDNEDWTALMYALRYNQPESARFLIELGVDINVKNKNNVTPLMFALRYEQAENAALLIEKGANVNAADNENWTPLMYALKYNQPENAKLLMKNHVNVNAADNEKWTPLMYALRYNQPENAKLLIEKGANVYAENNTKWTPIMFANDNKYFDIVDMIKRAQGDYDFFKMSNRTDSNETNKDLTENTFDLASGIDAIMIDVSAPSTGVIGTSISVNATVKNQGVKTMPGFYVGLYISDDAIITTSDIRIGTAFISSLAADLSRTVTTSVLIPSTLDPDRYYIGAIADYNYSCKETDETNNALSGDTIDLTKP